MKKINNKGFSLIEVLAVVVILGIVMSISIISIRSVINKSHDEYFKNLEQNIISAAEAFTDKNRSYLPKNVGKRKDIWLEELIENNYIKKPKSYNKNECRDEDIKASYVTVFKYNKTSYNYTVFLQCHGKESVKKELDNTEPKITIDFKNLSEKENAVASIKYEACKTECGKSNKLYSYSYILSIYVKDKNDPLGKKKVIIDVVNTGNMQANGVVAKDVNIKLADYIYSKGYNDDDITSIRVTASAVNYSGINKTEHKFTETPKDEIKPKCEIIKENKNWTHGTVKVTVKCSDNQTGCIKNNYSKTFKKSTTTTNIKVMDFAGNDDTCENVKVMLDNTTPTCDISGMPTEWVNTDVTIKATCKSVDKKGDSFSGCTEESTKTFKVTSNDEYIVDYKLFNRAGGTGKCKAKLHLMIDKKPPTIEKCNEMNLKGKNPSCKAKDNESGVSKILYCLKENDKTVPNNNDSCFNKTTNDDLINNKGKDACGKTYYLYAIAVDKMGNRSDVIKVGEKSSGENKCTHADWDKDCLEKETEINCNNSCVFIGETTKIIKACKKYTLKETCCYRGNKLIDVRFRSYGTGRCDGWQDTGYTAYCINSNGEIYEGHGKVSYKGHQIFYWCQFMQGLGVIDDKNKTMEEIQAPSLSKADRDAFCT